MANASNIINTPASNINIGTPIAISGTKNIDIGYKINSFVKNMNDKEMQEKYLADREQDRNMRLQEHYQAKQQKINSYNIIKATEKDSEYLNQAFKNPDSNMTMDQYIAQKQQINKNAADLMEQHGNKELATKLLATANDEAKQQAIQLGTQKYFQLFLNQDKDNKPFTEIKSNYQSIIQDPNVSPEKKVAANMAYVQYLKFTDKDDTYNHNKLLAQKEKDRTAMLQAEYGEKTKEKQKALDSFNTTYTTTVNLLDTDPVLKDIDTTTTDGQNKVIQELGKRVKDKKLSISKFNIIKDYLNKIPVKKSNPIEDYNKIQNSTTALVDGTSITTNGKEISDTKTQNLNQIKSFGNNIKTITSSLEDTLNTFKKNMKYNGFGSIVYEKDVSNVSGLEQMNNLIGKNKQLVKYLSNSSYHSGSGVNDKFNSTGLIETDNNGKIVKVNDVGKVIKILKSYNPSTGKINGGNTIVYNPRSGQKEIKPIGPVKLNNIKLISSQKQLIVDSKSTKSTNLLDTYKSGTNKQVIIDNVTQGFKNKIINAIKSHPGYKVTDKTYYNLFKQTLGDPSKYPNKFRQFKSNLQKTVMNYEAFNVVKSVAQNVGKTNVKMFNNEIVIDLSKTYNNGLEFSKNLLKQKLFSGNINTSTLRDARNSITKVESYFKKSNYTNFFAYLNHIAPKAFNRTKIDPSSGKFILTPQTYNKLLTAITEAANK